MPRYEDLAWTDANAFSAERFYQLMAIDREAWKAELGSHRELFERLYDRLPKDFSLMRELLLSGLWRSPARWELAHERYFDDHERA
jgi:phosphoenolpyruvate carboxykinase (GTP)